LRRSLRKLVALGATVGLLAALAAVLASPAMASIVNGKFSASTVKLTTTGVTLKLNGGDPRTCTLVTGATSGSTSVGSSDVLLKNTFTGGTEFNCSGSSIFQMVLSAHARYDTVSGRYFLLLDNWPTGTKTSPWGQYTQEAPGETMPDPTWVNGSGATKSTLKFENEPLGFTESGGSITMTGTFSATTSTGALLTLSH
jgi:hypothetical protein